MTTVNTQDNPVAPIVGAKDADAVIISSQQNTTNLVNYQIEKISTSDVYSLNSDSASKGGNLISITRTTLKIILESRTKFRVRTKSQFGAWSVWVNFTTRDKKYSSPHAITTLTDDTDSSAQTQGRKTLSGGSTIPQGGNRVIVVTNNAKSTEWDNARRGKNEKAPRKWGAATVTNTDTVYNGGQLQALDILTADNKHSTVDVPVVNIPTGAKVINVPRGKNARIRYTDRGATINTIG